MAIIPYDSIEQAEQRSAEFWEQVRGPGWQPGNVTTKLYPTRQRLGTGPNPETGEDPDADLPDGVDYAIQVTERKPYRLDPLIANEVMTALEAVPCAEFYPAWTYPVDYEVGNIVTYTDGNLYVVRQGHRSQVDWFPPVVTPTLFMVYRANADTLLDWIAGEKVELGWQRTYNGDTYECLQGHVTQSDWTPDVVPNLWSLVTPPTEEWQAGVNYQIDDVVTYNNVEYVCIQAHDSIVGWEPPNVPALWTEV